MLFLHVTILSATDLHLKTTTCDTWNLHTAPHCHSSAALLQNREQSSTFVKMSYNTANGLPLESRHNRCEQHPIYEGPTHCSTCESNRRQHQANCKHEDATYELANRDYSPSLYRCNLEQDTATTNYEELRNSARDSLYGADGSVSESYYRSYDSRTAYPTRSSIFRDPFERGGHAKRGQDGGDFRWEKSANSTSTTVRYADRPPPDNCVLDSLGSNSRRKALSGNSGGGWSHSQCPQQ